MTPLEPSTPEPLPVVTVTPQQDFVDQDTDYVLTERVRTGEGLEAGFADESLADESFTDDSFTLATTTSTTTTSTTTTSTTTTESLATVATEKQLEDDEAMEEDFSMIVMTVGGSVVNSDGKIVQFKPSERNYVTFL